MQNQTDVGGIQMNNNNPFSNNDQQQPQFNQQNAYQQQPYIGGAQINQGYQQPIYGQQVQYGAPVLTNQPMMMIGQPNVIVTQNKEYPFQANYSPFPMQITCPNCNTQGVTVIRNEIGSGTYLASLVLLCFTGILCCWVPCCMVDCQDKIHVCSSCGQEVGIRPYAMCA